MVTPNCMVNYRKCNKLNHNCIYCRTRDLLTSAYAKCTIGNNWIGLLKGLTTSISHSYRMVINNGYGKIDFNFDLPKKPRISPKNKKLYALIRSIKLNCSTSFTLHLMVCKQWHMEIWHFGLQKSFIYYHPIRPPHTRTNSINRIGKIGYLDLSQNVLCALTAHKQFRFTNRF